jgi:hypothetical protein
MHNYNNNTVFLNASRSTTTHAQPVFLEKGTATAARVGRQQLGLAEAGV